MLPHMEPSRTIHFTISTDILILKQKKWYFCYFKNFKNFFYLNSLSTFSVKEKEFLLKHMNSLYFGYISEYERNRLKIEPDNI